MVNDYKLKQDLLHALVGVLEAPLKAHGLDAVDLDVVRQPVTWRSRRERVFVQIELRQAAP